MESEEVVAEAKNKYRVGVIFKSILGAVMEVTESCDFVPEIEPDGNISILCINGGVSRYVYDDGLWAQIIGDNSIAAKIQERSEELWDKYSEHIGEDIDSLQYFAGRIVITESNFRKLIEELKSVK